MTIQEIHKFADNVHKEAMTSTKDLKHIIVDELYAHFQGKGQTPGLQNYPIYGLNTGIIFQNTGLPPLKIPTQEQINKAFNKCNHSWSVYTGLNYKEDYCTKCNEKKNKKGIYD